MSKELPFDDVGKSVGPVDIDSIVDGDGPGDVGDSSVIVIDLLIGVGGGSEGLTMGGRGGGGIGGNGRCCGSRSGRGGGSCAEGTGFRNTGL